MKRIPPNDHPDFPVLVGIAVAGGVVLVILVFAFLFAFS